jgi:glycosyltransferase involved in cell wall biosynthesis
MNLLIYFHYFAPSVGGVESIVQSLAAGVAELRALDGDNEFNVTVVTEAAAGNYDDSRFPFRVVRRPGVMRLWQLVRASDVIHAAGLAFLPMFLAWLSRKRFVPVVSKPAVIANVSGRLVPDKGLPVLLEAGETPKDEDHDFEI